MHHTTSTNLSTSSLASYLANQIQNSQFTSKSNFTVYDKFVIDIKFHQNSELSTHPKFYGHVLAARNLFCELLAYIEISTHFLLS